MDKLITEISTLLKDYCNSNGETISKRRIKAWINQFDENDREFLLGELCHILPKCYLSKNLVIENLKSAFAQLAKKYEYNNIVEFLADTKFLDCQGPLKSQTVLLEFINEIIQKEYKINIASCGSKQYKFLLYIDDVLASGGRYRKDISGIINSHKSKIESGKLVLINIFFMLHEWGYSNTTYSLSLSTGIKHLAKKIHTLYLHQIDNDPRIHEWYNPSPKFNHVYPIDTNNEKAHTYLESLDNLDILDKYELKHEKFAFRNENYPKEEKYYSSSESRNRYEQIILEKSIDIVNKIDEIRAEGLRPLGFTHPTYKILGTGSHAFTWRNVSNTCPLVFWWENHGWTPLFPIANRGRH